MSLGIKILRQLPGAIIIRAEVEVPDMIWIWEVFRLAISFGSYQFYKSEVDLRRLLE
jgi:hypothetical protein